MEVIYCAGGNRTLAEIAVRTGFRYGAQLPDTVYYPPYFVDQNWRKPKRTQYMRALSEHRPQVATVLDLERPEQRVEVLDWAEEAAQHVGETVIIIPKYGGAIASLPRQIGGKQVRLGYSVPTTYGGTTLPLWDFYDWPVHLLGGSPQDQMRLARYLHVESADGNAAQKAAVKWCTAWDRGRWKQLRYLGIDRIDNALEVAFEISCRNILAEWKKVAP